MKLYTRTETVSTIVEARGITPDSAQRQIGVWIYGRKIHNGKKSYFLKPKFKEGEDYVRKGSKIFFTEDSIKKIKENSL